jgi:hypothetical protein
MISRLFGRERTWSWRRLTRGDFGPITPVEGVLHATLAGAETYNGRPFSEAQLAAAGIIKREATDGT